MSCLCQYIGDASGDPNRVEPMGFPLPSSIQTETGPTLAPESDSNSAQPVTDDTKIAFCVSEMAACRSENWLLKKKVEEYEVTIKNLEQLMTTIMNKQYEMLADLLQLRQRNQELQTECNLQREYHAMERNALIKELYDVKTFNKVDLNALSEEEVVAVQLENEGQGTDYDYEEIGSESSSPNSSVESSHSDSMYSETGESDNDDADDGDEEDEEEEEDEYQLDPYDGLAETESD